MMYVIDGFRNDESCDPAYRGRTMRVAQNGCNGPPARRSRMPSRVGAAHTQTERDWDYSEGLRGGTVNSVLEVHEIMDVVHDVYWLVNLYI